MNKKIAEALYNAGYRQIDENCAVITKAELKEYKRQAVKEFAEKLKEKAHSVVGFNVRKKVYAKEYKDKLSSVYELDGRLGAYDIKDLFPEAKQIFKNPKPVQVIQRIISFALGNDDIFKPLVVYKMFYDLAVTDKFESWQLFFRMPNADFARMLNCLESVGDLNMLRKLTSIRRINDGTETERLADCIKGNTRYIENQMMEYITNNISLFDEVKNED